MAKAPAVKWTREHLLIALNLYCKLPFGQLHKRNPLIIEVAEKMGRTDNSLAIKLCNFAHLDPVLAARGIKGMEGVSKMDRIMWREFQEHLPTLAPESEQLLHDLFTKDNDKELDFLEGTKIKVEFSSQLTMPTGPTEILRSVRARRGQQFFRQAVIRAYDVRCCITGIGIPRLLRASHIKPWRDFPEDRLKPSNGLCLSAIHDAAFDCGLMTFDKNLCVVLSKRLKKHLPQPALDANFLIYEGHPLRLPEKLAEPDTHALEHHRTKIFLD